MKHVTLRTGERLRIRPIRPGDKPLLRALHESLSAESQYKRFLSTVPHLSAKMEEYLTECDHHLHEGLFAFDATSGAPVGTARFIRLAPGGDTAEFALTVTDAWQHKGVGTILFDLLIERAREEGVHHFLGEVLTTNSSMHHLMGHYGHPEVRRRDAGVETLEIDLD